MRNRLRRIRQTFPAQPQKLKQSKRHRQTTARQIARKMTRAGAVTNLRDLPGAHPYSLLQEGKREGKNSAQSTDARTKANDDHTDQYGDYYGFSAKAAESIAGSASKAANCHYSITLQTFAYTSNNPNTPNLRKSIDSGCIYSGRGDHKNNPDSVHVKDHGPIWPGLFTMKPNTKPGHEGWYALQPVGWSKVDSFLYHMSIIRGGRTCILEMYPTDASRFIRVAKTSLMT